MALRRGASRDPRLTSRRSIYLRSVLIISLTVIQAPWMESKEAVIFEQFGQLAGVSDRDSSTVDGIKRSRYI